MVEGSALRALALRLVVLASLGLAGCATSETPGPRGIALEDVTVIDGTGAPARPHQVVLLRGTEIEQVGPIGSIVVPPEFERIDAAGQFVIPGFVDLHVHLPEDRSVHQPILDRLLEFGITLFLNPGARPGAGVELRERIRNGDHTGPRMVTAGAIIEGSRLESRLDWATEVDTVEAIRHEVQAQARRGVDWIKLYEGLRPELVAAGIDEAHRLGVPVVGHMRETTWGAAARMGIDMLVHSGWGTPMDEVISLEDTEAASDAEWYRAYADAPGGPKLAELIAALVEAHVVVVPTLSITQASQLGEDASLLPLFRTELAPERDLAGWWDEGWRVRHPQYEPDSEEEAELLRTVFFPGVLGIHREFHERGVRLGVGTDVGNSWMTPGVVFHHELELYQDAGIPPLAILSMATRNGAEALGLLASTGTVEPGKRGDLILLGSDPTSDIRNTRDIVSVFLAGRPVDRD